MSVEHRWHGGLMVRMLDSQLVVAGSVAGHDISQIGDHLVIANHKFFVICQEHVTSKPHTVTVTVGFGFSAQLKIELFANNFPSRLCDEFYTFCMKSPPSTRFTNFCAMSLLFQTSDFTSVYSIHCMWIQ